MREVETLAVLDRIVDGRHAVLIVGDPPEREVIVPAGSLPDGTREGHWLRIRLDGDHLAYAEIDEAATTAAEERVRSKMNRLRRRGRRLGD